MDQPLCPLTLAEFYLDQSGSGAKPPYSHFYPSEYNTGLLGTNLLKTTEEFIKATYPFFIKLTMLGG